MPRLRIGPCFDVATEFLEGRDPFLLQPFKFRPEIAVRLRAGDRLLERPDEKRALPAITPASVRVYTKYNCN